MLPALEGAKGAKATLGMPKEGDGKTFEAISEVGRGRVLYEHTAGKKVGLRRGGCSDRNKKARQ